MGKRRRMPATLSPVCPGGSGLDPSASSNDHCALCRASKSDPQTPDSIEPSDSALFTRMRALRPSGPESTLSSSPSDATGTSSYYGDDESCSVGWRDLGLNALSTLSLPGVIAFGSIPQNSVPDSTLMKDMPMSASYLPSSRPSVHKGYLGKQKLDGVPSPGEAPQARNDDLEDSSGGGAEEDPQITDGGFDPEKVRKKILDRPPSEPIPTTDPIVAVIYDSSSSTQRSMRPGPGLFAHKLFLPDHANLIKIPSNPMEIPQPLMNVIPLTPETWTREEVNSTAIENWTEVESPWADGHGQALDLASRVAAYTRTFLYQGDVGPGRSGRARTGVASQAGDNSGTESFKTANELQQDDEILALPTEAPGTTEIISLGASVVRDHRGFIYGQGKYEQSSDPEAKTETLGAARDAHHTKYFKLIRREGRPSHSVGPLDGRPRLPVEVGRRGWWGLDHLGDTPELLRGEGIQILDILEATSWMPRSMSQPIATGIRGGGIGAYEKRELLL
ncbi:hypothetical protein HOY82DRAFT_542453 [Tuber indicum]|nr:hypothetical protein HOY82DRAFT_542453 [Tuber indicum]